MVEVIEGNYDDKQVVDIKCLFPTLKTLNFRELPKLRWFWKLNHILELPLLEEVEIYDCQVMETFTLGSLNTPKLKELRLGKIPILTAFNHDNNPFHLFCNPKVEIGGLKTLQESFNNLQELIIYIINGIRSLMSYSIAKNLVSLQSLEIRDCEELVEMIEYNEDDKQVVDCQVEPFTLGSLKLKELRLVNLPNLTSFCQGIENIKFPQLTVLQIGALPKLNSFCGLNSETVNHDTNPFHLFCNPKVEIGGLKTLNILHFNYYDIRNIWCHQIPINFFNNLEELKIFGINGIRSLMSYSIAKNLVSLKNLQIRYCDGMVEVIEGNDDDDKQVVDIKCLFPTLKTLEFEDLPKLRRFWQWSHALEMPLLENVRVNNCPVMETFTLGSLNTPKFDGVDN